MKVPGYEQNEQNKQNERSRVHIPRTGRAARNPAGVKTELNEHKPAK
jgi:hypothetical protein